MSIQTQIERLTEAKATLKTAIEQKGVDVPEGAPLEQYAPLVEQITGGDREWTLFQTITGDGKTVQWNWDGLDFSELLFKGVGLTNIHESTASSLQIFVNNTTLSNLDTQKAQGASETKYQYTHLRYNGMFWEVRKGLQCNNEASYYSQFTNLQSPYSIKLNHGKCTAVKVSATVPQYTLKSGTLEIYAR